MRRLISRLTDGSCVAHMANKSHGQQMQRYAQCPEPHFLPGLCKTMCDATEHSAHEFVDFRPEHMVVLSRWGTACGLMTPIVPKMKPQFAAEHVQCSASLHLLAHVGPGARNQRAQLVVRGGGLGLRSAVVAGFPTRRRSLRCRTSVPHYSPVSARRPSLSAASVPCQPLRKTCRASQLYSLECCCGRSHW